MKLHDSLTDPPPAEKLVLGIWHRGGVPEHVALIVKGPGEREWHSPSAARSGITGGNLIVFNPTYWIALEDMPPIPDKRGDFPKYEIKFSLFDHGWPKA